MPARKGKKMDKRVIKTIGSILVKSETGELYKLAKQQHFCIDGEFGVDDRESPVSLYRYTYNGKNVKEINKTTFEITIGAQIVRVTKCI